MKQVIRKGLKEIIVDEVPDPVVTSHHVLVRPHCSLISSGTETASIHTDGLIKEVSENPRHVRMIWNVMKDKGPSELPLKYKLSLANTQCSGIPVPE